MLAQAKRLAELQKRRELKQAGLLSSNARRKAKRSRDIDLGVEIPFHKPAPAGFHDVSREAAQSEAIRAKRMKSVDFKKLNEQQYRSRDRDAAQSKKREEARLRTLERSNMQYVVAQVSKANDPLNIRKRGPLELPDPSISDRELNQMAKLDNAIPEAATASVGSGATKALLADYSDRPLPTPMRTPMSNSSNNNNQASILQQASNLRMLEQSKTPLLGGDDDPTFEVQKGSSIDEGAKTPLVPMGGVKTPKRDQFGLNERPQSELLGPADDAISVGGTTFATNTSIRDLAREERRAAKLARKQLESALAALPAPQFDYELEAPMVIDDEEKDQVKDLREEDAADIDAAERKRAQEEADKLYEERSSVVKRSILPRPVGTIPESKIFSENDAEQLIDVERWTLLRHDAHAFPVVPPPSLHTDKKKKKKKQVKKTPLPPETPLEILSEEYLNAAKDELQSETLRLLQEKAQPLLNVGNSKDESLEILNERILNESRKSQSAKEVFVVDKGWTNRTDKTLIQTYTSNLDTLLEATSALRKKNEKTESKLAVLIGGYSKRSQALSSEMMALYTDLRNNFIEEAVYLDLQAQEERGSVSRIDRLRGDIQKLKQDESLLQHSV